MDSIQIQTKFISLLEERDFRCQKYESKIRRTNNIIELLGRINCLLYFKIRSEAPHRWGVTKNRIEELQTSGKKWFIVLLFETPNSGYLLTPQHVKRYINESLWPLGRDKNKNEYKISTGKTLQYNEPFYTFGDFINSLGYLPTYEESLSEIPDMRYEEYPPNKITTTITRTVRDTTLSIKVKEERNYRCQVCGTTLFIKGKGYAETHHVKPLSQEGPDIESNMLVLCPNHHILFDYGEIAVSPEDGKTVIDGGGHGTGTLKPPFPKKEYVEYHYHNIYKK